MNCGPQKGREMRRSWTSALQDAERIAVLERIVEEAKAAEEQDARLATNKLLSRRILLKATADRLEQQIRLESARTK